MKTLQNNFTTPEQSKRLSALGVPADSADCIYVKHVMNSDYDLEILKERSYSEEVSEFEGFYDYIPCWSVGRLMEIFDICNLYDLHKFSTRDWSVNIKKLMRDYEVAAEENMLDFSKLEE